MRIICIIGVLVAVTGLSVNNVFIAAMLFGIGAGMAWATGKELTWE